MYKNFWYPVAASHEITNNAPLRVRIMHLDFAAFRGSNGQAHVLADTCVHRGGALGAGKIKTDCIECPYHGWQFDGNGRCQVIPSLKDESPPARAKVDSYPVQEKYGIVFAFLGDLPESERPPLWEIEEYEAEGWRANKLVVFDVDYYYERSVENALDPAHNEFVHPKQGAPGMMLDFKKTPIQIEKIQDWGSGFMMPFSQIEPDDGLLDEANSWSREVVTAGSGHFGPNAVVTWLHFNERNWFHQYFFEAPIDEKRTRIFFVNMRRFMLEPDNDQRIIDINMEIAQEDIDLLINLNPVQTPESLSKEILVPSDKPIVSYREYLKEWEKLGWKLDQNKIKQLRDNLAMAIPSPNRKIEKNWVLDEVPTI
ncbi:MAG: aromatic ring-hydroxylating dioxygenase subunit alpha [Pseudomonadota bacterium]|nr:aromatic ring-hydroxylating dioxygenase subunit alpha [Pseudomonadota bacterium]